MLLRETMLLAQFLGEVATSDVRVDKKESQEAPVLRFITMTWRPIILYNHQFGSCIKGPPWIESMVFNREGRDASSAWDERAVVFTVMRVGVMSPWTILNNYNCPEPKWNWSSKSHLAVINHHESPLDFRLPINHTQFPMKIALKYQANPPICLVPPRRTLLWGRLAQQSPDVLAARGGASLPVIDGGSSWNLMLKMLTFRNLLVIYDSYGDLIWSNDI